MWVVGVRPKKNGRFPRAKWHIFWPQVLGARLRGKHASVGVRVSGVPGCIPSQALGKLHHIVHTIMRDKPLDSGPKR